jgi:hypothetical protein
LGRGIVGVRKVTTTTRDGTSTAEPTTRTTQFDLDSKVCHDADHNQCAYANAALPAHQTTTIPIVDGDVWRIVDTQARQTMDVQVGPVGYRTTQVIQTSLEAERRAVGRRSSDSTLRATRATRIFDGYGNVITSRSELSKDVLPLDGSVAAGQNVYTLLQQATPSNPADTTNWLISRYPQYQRVSTDPTLPINQRTVTQTINLTYEP